jgi:hypothetical protein
VAGKLRTKVSGRYQSSLPSAAQQRLHIQKGGGLSVDIQDGLSILTPEPNDRKQPVASRLSSE